ncbi:hypothetical protein [Clostridium perfringens]|uniref:hypothetical protein n=1 Tax=Clostridium perfringens TaxID=1502 RepID=UPI001CAB564E|nr:hypothetical protein [Clostridium perfringens]MDZ4992626.1 hypothetical protein [Clostridium perfringens]WPQ46711.1 hypothetical protein SK065_04935 [Clostridium perfringens]HBI6903869.1 hypothetical protein [Clostridium perfringens]
MNFFKKNKIAIISIAIIIIFVVLLLIGIHHYFGDYFKYSEWVTLLLNSIISIAGIIGTVITILIAITSINNEKRNNELKKRKIAIILEYEINSFLSSLFDTFYLFLYSWNYYNFNDLEKPTFQEGNLNMLSLDFKETLYELISIEESSEGLEIFEFFKIYKNCIQKLDKFNDDERSIFFINSFIDIFEFSFSNEYSQALNLLKHRTYGRCHNYLPINDEEKEILKAFYNNKIDLYKSDNKDDLLKKEYSERLINILKYLNSLK